MSRQANPVLCNSGFNSKISNLQISVKLALISFELSSYIIRYIRVFHYISASGLGELHYMKVSMGYGLITIRLYLLESIIRDIKRRN
jgi:hypothetical protein